MKTTFIIFGSTGDLAKRKLFPALYSIYKNKKNKKIDILAIGRRDFDDNIFRDYITKQTVNFINQKKDFSGFLKTISYFKVEVSNKKDYFNLGEFLNQKYKNTQIIIYLSIAPEFFTKFIDNSKVLNLPKNTRIIFEKPFGKDLKTACILNEKITQFFLEKQIYRIDHYVGKEAIQNILAFRFANMIFEPIWNNKYIDNIQITASEKIGIENRGGYYETSGALRDMVQNHLFQVLTLITMDPPSLMDAENISNEKLKILKSIKILKNFEKDIVFGQYDGYKNELGISKKSKTETFVALKIEISNWRMIGVPIYLKTGKMLDKKCTRIIVEFKEIPDLLFKKFGHIEKNRIIFEVQPNELIDIHFNIKENGNSKGVQRVQSKFKKKISSKEEYEKLIEDVIVGDKTLFTTFDILKESWSIVDDLVNCKDNCPILHKYIPGTTGPEVANDLLTNDGKKWYE